jgi:hypothetical protein
MEEDLLFQEPLFMPLITLTIEQELILNQQVLGQEDLDKKAVVVGHLDFVPVQMVG